MQLREHLAIGKESFEDGNKSIELEYTFYGKLSNPQELEEKAYEKETMEQWDVPLDTDVPGKLRIRRVGDGRYLQCTKIKREGQKGQEEVELEITEDMYYHLREMGVNGRIKTRYYFKVEGRHDMIWEIDVFKNQSGEDSIWVKVDLEVPNEETEIPPLPVTFNEFIAKQGHQLDEEEKVFIAKLWSREWVELEA